MRKIFLFTVLLGSFFTVVTFGQSIKVGIGGGLTALTGDNSYTAENAANLSSGIQYGGKLVVGLPLLPIQFFASAYNNPLSSEYTDETTDLTIKSETSFLSAGIGAEMTLLPGPLQPYIAGELLYTSFGETTTSIEGIDYVSPAADNGLGVGLGAGLYFKLLPVIDIDLSAHYNMNTLLSDGETMNSTHVRLNILFSIL
jgi:hypothetical protein